MNIQENTIIGKLNHILYAIEIMNGQGINFLSKYPLVRGVADCTYF